MSNENNSSWERTKKINKLKKAIERSKNKCLSNDNVFKWIALAESLGYFLLVDQCDELHSVERFRNFRVAQVVEL
ncbi:MAG: hypothetical protein HOG63_08335 [Nitrospina sp.]|jgi:hypothetical protein|nr:hypothetical protein [Deltaproteobacteria bacterium]MBT5958567.1 hypothetical protein [Nitrospina sp.]